MKLFLVEYLDKREPLKQKFHMGNYDNRETAIEEALAEAKRSKDKPELLHCQELCEMSAYSGLTIKICH